MMNAYIQTADPSIGLYHCMAGQVRTKQDSRADEFFITVSRCQNADKDTGRGLLKTVQVQLFTG